MVMHMKLILAAHPIPDAQADAFIREYCADYAARTIAKAAPLAYRPKALAAKTLQQSFFVNINNNRMTWGNDRPV